MGRPATSDGRYSSDEGQRSPCTGVGEARKQYIRWLLVTRDFSPHTIRAYDGDVAALEQHLGADAAVVEIDRDCLVAFVEEQQAEGLSPTSIRRRASGLRGFCRWLVARGLLSSDPWAGTAVAAGRSHRLPRVLPSHELDRLLLFLRKAAEVDDLGDTGPLLERPHESTTLLAVALMVATGVRVNEAVGIQCRDIDLPGRSIRLVGKGRRERQVFLTNDWISGFTGGLPGDALPRLASSTPASSSTYAWTPHNASDALTTRQGRPSRRLEHQGHAAHAAPHRSDPADRAGVDIRYIQRLLGHASLTTTEIYTHVSDHALRQVVSDADILGRWSSDDN